MIGLERLWYFLCIFLVVFLEGLSGLKVGERMQTLSRSIALGDFFQKNVKCFVYFLIYFAKFFRVSICTVMVYNAPWIFALVQISVPTTLQHSGTRSVPITEVKHSLVLKCQGHIFPIKASISSLLGTENQVYLENVRIL